MFIFIFLLISQEDVVTTNGFLDYKLVYYKDQRTSLHNGLLYANDTLQNCSIQELNLLTFGQAPQARVHPTLLVI